MKFTKFEIRNFKGIKSATLDLTSKPSVYTLVGLNESGKTTILEAINNFNPDVDGIHALAQTPTSPDHHSWIPKEKMANFNDTIKIIATVAMNESDVNELVVYCNNELKIEIDSDSIPTNIVITTSHEFKNSNRSRRSSLWDFFPKIKKPRQKKFNAISAKNEEWHKIVKFISTKLPRIIYFPTFLFDFPDKILISESANETKENKHYRMMIKDALLSLDMPLDIEEHIIKRILNIENGNPYAMFMNAWITSHEKSMIDSALLKLEHKISNEIFKNWQEVLGTSINPKEIKITQEVKPNDADENIRDVYFHFSIKSGSSNYKISEHSLGFKWFFCFMFFTRFIGSINNSGAMFLFDEPASNLHSLAQKQLLKSLEKISGNKNDIIFSTHSHHLVNPLWLETAYIVSNKNNGDDEIIFESDIVAQKYRHFIGQNIEKNHYFQPILDCLDYKPSSIEGINGGVLVEGKSDFYILSWYKKYHSPNSKFDILPVGGANNAGTLISLYLGWGKKFILLLDSDDEGDKAKKRYINNFPLLDDRVIQINDVFGSDHNINMIEQLMSDNMLAQWKDKYSNVKNWTRLTFSESLTGENTLSLDDETLGNIKKLFDALEQKISQ